MGQSILVYQEMEAGGGQRAATVMALHGHEGDLEQLKPLCGKVGESVAVMLLEAKRAVSPHAASREVQEYGGYTWFLMQEVGYPEPASFGDSLGQVEKAIYGVWDRQGPPVYLVGYDQGAVLALTAGVLCPEYVKGVVGLCGYLPEIRGWKLPEGNLAGMTVLLVKDGQEEEAVTARVEQTVEELRKRGASVELKEVSGVRQDPVAAADVLREWLESEVAKESAQAHQSSDRQDG